MYYLLYVVIWIYITTTYADTKHKTEIISGFIFGLIILLILDYINNFSKQLVIDKNTGAFTLINSEAVYIADTLLKNNKIKAMPIFEYVNKQYAKLGGTKLGSPAATTDDQNLKLLGASYMIISLITLGMISSDISQTLSKNIMPYVTAATLFSVALLSLWIYTPNVNDMISIGVLKLKSLVIAISFSITACLIFLNQTK